MAKDERRIHKGVRDERWRWGVREMGETYLFNGFHMVVMISNTSTDVTEGEQEDQSCKCICLQKLDSRTS